MSVKGRDFVSKILVKNFESSQDLKSQILTFEEDGRFGNHLLETATLIMIGSVDIDFSEFTFLIQVKN